MAHEIVGNKCFAFKGDRSEIWHGLGTQMPDDATAWDMYIAGGLDYEVKRALSYAVLKYPVYNEDGSAKIDADGNHVAREDVRYSNQDVLYSEGMPGLLNPVSSEWKIFQNREAVLEVAERIINFGRENGIEFVADTAGVLCEGEKAFMNLSLPGEGFSIKGKDHVSANLLILNMFRYGFASSLFSTATRGVCNNTVSAIQSEGKGKRADKIASNHRVAFDAAGIMAKIEETHKFMQAYQERAEFLCEVRIEDAKLREYFGTVFPLTSNKQGNKELSRNALQALAVLDNQPGANLFPGTWWQAFNAVTYMHDHLLGRTDAGRFDKAMFGTGVSDKRKALDLAIEFAQAA